MCIPLSFVSDLFFFFFEFIPAYTSYRLERESSSLETLLHLAWRILEVSELERKESTVSTRGPLNLLSLSTVD